MGATLRGGRFLSEAFTIYNNDGSGINAGRYLLALDSSKCSCKLMQLLKVQNWGNDTNAKTFVWPRLIQNGQHFLLVRNGYMPIGCYSVEKLT